jgi:hypothetical protein
MNVLSIDAKKTLAAVKFDAAREIRIILDKARDQYGDEAWAEDDMETEIIDLVTGEDP